MPAAGSVVASVSVSAKRARAARSAGLRPEDPTALNNLAWLQLQQGKPAEAAPLITRAIQIAPYDPSLLDTLAAVQASLGRCSEAAASQARAIDALPEGVSAARRRDFEGRLERYRTRCSSGAPTAGSGG